MLKTIFLVLAAILVVFVIIVAMQPAKFRITRTITIGAPPALIFGHINDLHQWEAWSPWAKIDPNATMTFEGPAAGTGAKYHWSGNSKVGEGAMTVIDSRPGELVQLQLDFKKPFEATNIADFTFKPEGDQTVVTWGMSGTNNFVFKAVGLFMNCDKMIGGEFEKGLRDLKTVAEAEVKK